MTQLLLALGGLVSGLLAGLLGIGGGVVLVPLIATFGYSSQEATATSLLAIAITATSGSFQNWRAGGLDLKKVLIIAIPSVISAQLGIALNNRIPSHWLLVGFSILLLINIVLANWRRRASKGGISQPATRMNPILARLLTGVLAGFLAGLFGVGGGVIMVPLQLVLLAEPIKAAVRTSLGVIVITAIAGCVGQALQGNVRFSVGIVLGVGGLIGAQASTRFLPRLSDRAIATGFNLLLAFLVVYTLWQAWLDYQNLAIGHAFVGIL